MGVLLQRFWGPKTDFRDEILRIFYVAKLGLFLILCVIKAEIFLMLIKQILVQALFTT